GGPGVAPRSAPPPGADPDRLIDGADAPRARVVACPYVMQSHHRRPGNAPRELPTRTPHAWIVVARGMAGAAAIVGALSGASPGALAPRDLRMLDSPAAARSGEACLAVAPDGGLFMSWFERRDTTDHATLRVARLIKGRWSKPLTVAEGDSF